MSTDLEFTGERFLPEVSGQIAFEHLHRYYFARDLIKGCRVLDVACGEGYGSWILSDSALQVVGVDIAADAVTHARKKYTKSNMRFVEASAAKLPFDDDMFDAVVSFETIEHLDLHQEMLSEIKRVLNKDGLLIISSPNKQYYSIEPGYQNPFHVKELFREEFLELIKSYFSNAMLFGQRVVHGSLMVRETEQATTRFESMFSDGSDFHSINGLAKPLYDLLIASDALLPVAASSLFEASVHGMVPAQFYGTHLPDRVATADARVLELQKLVELRGLTEGEARKLFDSLLARIDMFRSEEQSLLQEQLFSVHAQLKDAQIEVAIAKHSIQQIQLQLEHAHGQIHASEDIRAALVAEAAYLQLRFEEMETVARQAIQRTEVMEKTMAVVYQSTSWKLTAPLRWLKSTWKRFIHG